MTIFAAFLLVCLAVKVAHAEEVCLKSVSCPCGSVGENVTICADVDSEVCTRLSKCKKCERGSDICSECPKGFKGPLCSQAVEKTCENPGPISNGQIRFSIPSEIEEGSKMKLLPVHTEMEYFCNTGYQLLGPQSLTCKPSGLWSAQEPKCVRASNENCVNPGPISNGKVRFSHPTENVGQEMILFPRQTVREYFCNEGYRLLGSDSSTCDEIWYPSKPDCKIDCGRGFFNFGPCTLNNCNKHTPWLVSISVKDGDGVSHVCLGALLNYQTVLTAAHCLVGHSTYIIQFGKHRLKHRQDEPQAVVRRSSRIILHPDFSNTTFDSNIGLLFFHPRVRFTGDVQPICMQDYYKKDSEIGKTGIVSARDGLVRMTVLSIESCLEANHQVELFITKNSFCARSKDGYQSLFAGDSGAPLFFYDRSEGRFLLLGILNFGTRHSSNFPIPGNNAVFTKLDNFLKWIDENLQ